MFVCKIKTPDELKRWYLDTIRFRLCYRKGFKVESRLLSSGLDSVLLNHFSCDYEVSVHKGWTFMRSVIPVTLCPWDFNHSQLNSHKNGYSHGIWLQLKCNKKRGTRFLSLLHFWMLCIAAALQSSLKVGITRYLGISIVFGSLQRA